MLSEEVRLRARSGASSRTVLAYAAFLAVVLVIFQWAALEAAAFMPALNAAQLEFAYVLGGDPAVYGQFARSVFESWPGRIAAARAAVAPADAIQFAAALAIGTAAFYLTLSRPRGQSLLRDQTVPARLADAAREAIASFGAYSDMVRSTPRRPFSEAFALRGTLYLPAAFVERAFAPLTAATGRARLDFVMAHEFVHRLGFDNLAHSFLRCFFLVVLAAAGGFLVTPLVLSATLAMPRPLVTALGPNGSAALVAFIGLSALFVCAASAWLALSGYAAVREFHADRVALATVGENGFPYVPGANGEEYGTRFAPWSRRIALAERRLHAQGWTPRGHALVAGLFAIWLIGRSVLMIVAGDVVAGPVWLLDAACLGAIGLVWRELPAAPRGAGAYTLPWLALAATCAIVFLGIAGMVGLAASVGGFELGSAAWRLGFSWPLLIVMLLALFMALRELTGRGGASPSSLPRAALSPATAVVALLAVPGLVASLFLGGFALMMASRVGTGIAASLIAGDRDPLVYLLYLAPGTLLFLLVWLVVRNLVAPGRISAATEVVFVGLFGAALAYMAAAGQQTYADGPAEPGRELDPALVMDVAGSPTAEMAAAGLAGFVLFAILALLSWWPRWKIQR